MAMVLLFAVGTAYAATIRIENLPTDINKFTDPQFSFDILINDIDPLTNLDFWQLGLALSPESGATFVSASGDTDSNYVFFGDSDDFDYTLLSPYRITVGDLTTSTEGHTDVADNLLATVMIDISNADVCDWYSINLFDSSYTFFGDKDFNVQYAIALDKDYQFHVVPIPGAVWLLGSGLLGLFGLKRKMKS